MASNGRRGKSASSPIGMICSGSLLRPHGLSGIGRVYRNLPVPTLTEMAVARGEGYLAPNGALVVKTGKFTGRSPKDKFTVDQPPRRRKSGGGPSTRKFPSKTGTKFSRKS